MKKHEDDFHFGYKEEYSHEEEQILSNGLSEDAFLKKQLGPVRNFGIFIKDREGVILGGVTGFTYYGCLYTDMLFVKEDLRGKGFGKKLMSGVEKIGVERNCTFSTVNTMDFEALVFYQNLGYEIEFVREGYEKQSKMYMLRKQL